MPEEYDQTTLWMVLNEYENENIFQVYPKLLAQLLLQEEAARQDCTSEAEKLVLPSDKEWRLQQYFSLVALQKNLALEEDGDKPIKTVEEPPEAWAPWNLVVSIKNPHAPPPVAVKTAPGPAWDIGQVLKAGRLLCKPPLRVDFADEQEMRCVYSLIYDVFRYQLTDRQPLDEMWSPSPTDKDTKVFHGITQILDSAVTLASLANSVPETPPIKSSKLSSLKNKSILDQAIEDIEFVNDYPQFTNSRHIVWLFLMELARRRWGARARGEMEKATRLLEKAGSPFKDIENVIWEQRVHFAAAIARIRIKNKAFSLSDLLPPHLREEHVSACVNKETVTGWVNTFKAKKVAQLVKKLHDLGYSYSASRQLFAGEYRFDRVCPRFITLRPPENVSIGQLDLVKDGVIVLQEREFCEGASTLCRAIRANALQGVVAQTHASSPRCSAYLAAQLRELAAVLKAQTPAAPAIPELGKLVVFGAGDKTESYVLALRELGIEASEAAQSGAPVRVLSEPVHWDTPTVASALDGVVAALATPPNSYSAVTDPIDLVCGRGGDLAMLEVLTESEIDVKGKARVQSILEEQKKTLKTLLSKPQIQLILYETHSALEAENQTQVTRAVAEANRLARERHALLKKKHRDRQPSPQKHGAETIITDSLTSFDNTISRTDLDKDDFTVDEGSPKRPLSSSPPSTNRTNLHEATALKKQIEHAVTGSRPGTNKARPIPEMPGGEPLPRDPDKDSPDIYVPSCDLFEIRMLPNLGNGLDINYILDRDGCYLGLIQRKEITRLDAKYMIRMAEERGLFGSARPPGVAAQRRKRVDTAPAEARRRRRRNTGFEVERVAAPTYASLSRSYRRGSAPACLEAVAGADGACEHVCARHVRRQAAAAAISANACSCDARHRRNTQRRASDEVAAPPRPPSPPCRRPFPLAIHDLRLKTIVPQHKIVAS